ncbi:MAG: methyl-accepting chemotaxis protein [Bacillota bacterium]|nr:methyl-accepting chemotaxis protein [Bacillota bacterium]
MSIIDGLISGGNVIKQLLGNRYTLIISDLKSYKLHSTGTIDFGFKVNDNLVPGTLMHKAILENRRIVQKVDRQNSKFGFPYIGIAIPIIDGNEVTGALAIAESTDLQEKIIKMSAGLAATSQELNAIIENLTTGSETLATVAQNISEDAKEINTSIKNTDTILEVIHHITNSTHMLGLNAAIEAARAGEYGRGFSVVAEEIRKLSSNAKESQNSISTNLCKIRDSAIKLNGEINKIASMSEEQSASTEETSASVQELSAAAYELSMIADRLLEQ